MREKSFHERVSWAIGKEFLGLLEGWLVLIASLVFVRYECPPFISYY